MLFRGQAPKTWLILIFLVYEHVTQVSSRFPFLLKLQLVRYFCQKAVLVLQQSCIYYIWGGGGIHTLWFIWHTASPLLVGAAWRGKDEANPFCFKGSKWTWCVYGQWSSGQLPAVVTHCVPALTGCPGRLCRLHPRRFSRANWTMPWAIWPDLGDDPPVSRRLD